MIAGAVQPNPSAPSSRRLPDTHHGAGEGTEPVSLCVHRLAADNSMVQDVKTIQEVVALQVAVLEKFICYSSYARIGSVAVNARS